MSISYENGTPIAYDASCDKILNYSTREGTNEAYGIFSILPCVNRDREIVYCCGHSGSGKSTNAADYALKYRQFFPKNPIIMFSQFNEDKAFEKDLEGNDIRKKLLIRRIILDEEFSRMTINVIEEFHDCLIIFDDCLIFPDKNIANKIKDVIHQVLQLGRKNHISCFITSHLLYGDDTKLYRLLMIEIDKLIFYKGSNV